MDKGRLLANPTPGDGAFERFLTSAIATILTIIFSWRLLIENEANGGQLSIEGAPGRRKDTDEDGDAAADEGDVDTVDGGLVTDGETLAGSTDTLTRQTPTPDALDAFRVDTEVTERTYVVTTDPVVESISVLEHTQTLESSQSQFAWNFTHTPETAIRSHHLHDRSPVLSDSEESDGATRESDSASTDSDVRDFQVHDAFGDSSSDSEYCLVFNHILEAITEESDDVDSEIRSDDGAKGKRAIDDDTGSGHQSDVSSIGTYTIDDPHADEDAPKLPVRYGLVNTQRPLIIGPYLDRTSKFSTDPDHFIISTSPPKAHTNSTMAAHHAAPGETSIGPGQQGNNDLGGLADQTDDSITDIALVNQHLADGGLSDTAAANDEYLRHRGVSRDSISDTASVEGACEVLRESYGASCLDWPSSTTSDTDSPSLSGGSYQDSNLDESFIVADSAKKDIDISAIDTLTAKLDAHGSRSMPSRQVPGKIIPSNPRESKESPAHIEHTALSATQSTPALAPPQPHRTGQNGHIHVTSRKVNSQHSSFAHLSGPTSGGESQLFSSGAKQYKSEVFLSPSKERPTLIPTYTKVGQDGSGPIQQVAYLPIEEADGIIPRDNTDFIPVSGCHKLISVDNVSAREKTPNSRGQLGSPGTANQAPGNQAYRRGISRQDASASQDDWREVLVTESTTYVDCDLSSGQESAPRGFTFVRTTDVHTDYKLRDTAHPKLNSPGTQAMGPTQTMHDPGRAMHEPGRYYKENQCSATPGEARDAGPIRGSVRQSPAGTQARNQPAWDSYQSPHSGELNNKAVNERLGVNGVPEPPKRTEHSRQVVAERQPGVGDSARAGQPRSRAPLAADMTELYDENYDHALRQVYGASPVPQYGERATSPRRIGAVEALGLQHEPRSTSRQKPARPVMERPVSWSGNERERRTPTEDRGRPRSQVGSAAAAGPQQAGAGASARPPRPPDRNHSYGRAAELQTAVGAYNRTQGTTRVSPRGNKTCTALATSTALARKDIPMDEDNYPLADMPRPIISAVASAEATGENPYVAVARATARAATVASANAAAGAAALPDSPTRLPITAPEHQQPQQEDISVVISTSCRIRNDNPDEIIANSHEVIESLGQTPHYQINQPQGSPARSAPVSSSTKPPALESPQRRPPGSAPERPDSKQSSSEGSQRLTITIHQSRRQSAEQQTIDVELPERGASVDLTSIISDAVRRVLASHATPSGSPQLDRAIDRVTRQVLQAYSSDTEPEDTPGRQRRTYDLGVPAPNEQQTLPSQGYSRITQSQTSNTQSASRSLYVTGTYPNTAGTSGDEVVLHVVADADNQPSVQHVLMSDSESTETTPLATRKGHVMTASRSAVTQAVSTATQSSRARQPARDYGHTKMDHYGRYAYRPDAGPTPHGRQTTRAAMATDTATPRSPGMRVDMVDFPSTSRASGGRPPIPSHGVPVYPHTERDLDYNATGSERSYNTSDIGDKYHYISDALETDLEEYDSVAYAVHVERRGADSSLSECSEAGTRQAGLSQARAALNKPSPGPHTQPAGPRPVPIKGQPVDIPRGPTSRYKQSYPAPIKASHSVMRESQRPNDAGPRDGDARSPLSNAAPNGLVTRGPVGRQRHGNAQPRSDATSPVSNEPMKRGILKNSQDNLLYISEDSLKSSPTVAPSQQNGGIPRSQSVNSRDPSTSPTRRAVSASPTRPISASPTRPVSHGTTRTVSASPTRPLSAATEAKQLFDKSPTWDSTRSSASSKSPANTPTTPTPKPYDSVLLKPVLDGETPFHIRKQFEDPEKVPPSSRLKINDSRQDFLDKTQQKPVAYPASLFDKEFEARRQRWNNKPAPKSKGVMVVDIDFGDNKDNKKALTKSTEDIKKKLSAIRLKAPTSSFAEKAWPKVPLQAYRSHDRVNDIHSYGSLSRKSSTSSIGSNDGNVRKAKSMGTLPGQFFGDRRSYTSLMETNIDTLQVSKTPLVMETNLDDDLPIRTKSVTNLNSGTTSSTAGIDEPQRHRSLELINYSYMRAEEGTPIDENGDINQSYGSEHELRITQSLNKLSLPDWYRSSIRKSREKLNIRKSRPNDFPFSLSSEERSRPSSRSQSPGGRPVVIRHRVSSYTRSSNSATPTSPTADISFELPSAKLRNSDVDLPAMEVRDEIPLAMSRSDPGRESARDQYLRMKAGSSNSSSLRGSQEYIETTFDGHSETVKTENISSIRMKETVITKEGRYMAQTYIAAADREEDLRSAPQVGHIPNGQILERKMSDGSRSEDSANASLESSTRNKNLSQAEVSQHIFAVGKECSSLVQKLSSDFPDDSGIEVNNPDEVYAKMMNNLESSSKNIRIKAKLLSSEETARYAERDIGARNGEADDHDRRSYPVLMPGKQQDAWPEDILAVGEPVKVRMTKTSPVKEQVIRPASQIHEFAPAPPPGPYYQPHPQHTQQQSQQSRLRDTHSLDEVLDGLLAIPPPRSPASPRTPEQEPATSPNQHAMRMLKMAQTPQSSMTSVTSMTSSARDDEEYDTANSEEVSDINEETIMVNCSNPNCQASTNLKSARKSYKTCHNCYTYYCSRRCRKEHWERHKERCMYSRIRSACKHVIKRIHDSPELLEQFTSIARTGYLAKGRGCVILAFATHVKAIDFLNFGMRALESPPGFANIRELEAENVFGDHLSELLDMCNNYSPDLKFVIEVAIVALEDNPRRVVPRRDEPVIKKCAKLRLSHSRAQAPKRSDPETLILTAVPGSEFTENMEERKAREVCFINIQRRLRERGVSLRHLFPDVYRRLCAYVAHNERFAPITIYPIDGGTGKRFMCLIMPNAEPEVEWMYEPDLLEELGLQTEV